LDRSPRTAPLGPQSLSSRRRSPGSIRGQGDCLRWRVADRRDPQSRAVGPGVGGRGTSVCGRRRRAAEAPPGLARVEGVRMASFRGHIAFASVLGGIYGGVGSVVFGLDWGPVFLGAGLTAVGGLMPDLDSDSGVPVRELFSLTAVIAPLLLVRRLHHAGLTP